jgi:hypothetical protein
VTDSLALLGAIDRLYEAVVTDPAAWHEQAFADWAQDAAAGGIDRDQARAVRRALRMAEKLRNFWLRGEAAVVAEDWRTRVDVALGPRAWRPTLELAQHGLDVAPTSELFAEVRSRFRIVNSEPWMDGIDFETWQQTSQTEDE